MKLIGPSSAFAPMPTGHPMGLPGQMSVKDSQTRVTEPAKSNASNLSNHLGLLMRKPAHAGDDTTEAAAAQIAPNKSDDAPAQATPQSKTETAPPTILQIKINELLQAQADAQLEEAAPPEPASTPPASRDIPDRLETSPAEDEAAPQSDVRLAAETLEADAETTVTQVAPQDTPPPSPAIDTDGAPRAFGDLRDT